MRQRYAQFIKLSSGSMNFQANQVSNFERLGQERPYILEVFEQGPGICIPFPSKYFIIVATELIKEAARFCPGPDRKSRQSCLKLFKLSGMDLEIRMQTNEARQGVHLPSVRTAPPSRRARTALAKPPPHSSRWSEDAAPHAWSARSAHLRYFR